jgi:uncharacterized NAD-dependent epimerase/dehydratase family protein
VNDVFDPAATYRIKPPRWPAQPPSSVAQVALPSPYLLFLGDASDRLFIKTAAGLVDWAPDRCLGEWGLPSCAVSVGLPRMSPVQAAGQGARAIVIGAAPIGGALTAEWKRALLEAMDAGLHAVSGLHSRLNADPDLVAAAARNGVKLIDVREPPAGLQIGTGRRRSGKRLLTVGTDCALGKKYTALAISSALQDAGLDADFRASGQTGIMIAGSGMPIDAVVADFIAGAAEALSPAAAAGHWDVIEGQGSLFHPGYAGVSLGLLHGSQPDAMVLCHDPSRQTISDYPEHPIPDLGTAIDLHQRCARVTNPAARVIGISLNTSHLEADAAAELVAATGREIGLPVIDPVRGIGMAALIGELS